MNGLLTVLPLAFVMIAGPQIISAVFLATSVEWARNSAAYVLGAAISITIAYLVVKGAKGHGGSPSKGSQGQTFDAVLLVLLVFAAVNVYRKRNQGKPPKWMGELEEAKPKMSFRLGFLLLAGFRPTSSRRSPSAPGSRARATPGGRRWASSG